MRSITTATISLLVTYHSLKNSFKQQQDTSFTEQLLLFNMEHPDSPPRLRQRRRIELRQHEQDEEVAVAVAAGNRTVTNMYHLPEDCLNLSIAFLGVGHFRYQGIACKMLLEANEKQPGFKMITTSESVSASISCAQTYFEEVGKGRDQLEFFWYSVVRYDRVEIMRWAWQHDHHAHEYYFIMEYGLCSKAAKFGHLHVLQWLREKACPWDSSTCNEAAEFGHLHILRWARANGCDWNEETCSNAAYGGHLHILQWLRENGCPWDEDTCYFAARLDYLPILQWARANGCEWNEGVVNVSAEEGNISVFLWAIENGCDWQPELVLGGAARSYGNREVIPYIIQWYQDQGEEIPDYDLDWNLDNGLI